MTDIQDNSEGNFISRDFLKIVAHDLKAPISSVKGFIELLDSVGPLNEEQTHFKERAVHGLMRMVHLIDDVLELARLETEGNITFAASNLEQIIQESVEMFSGTAEAHNIQLHVSLVREASMVVGDARLLGMVINNLLGNAIKYNRDGGHVWINAYRQRKFVRVDIRDSGYGIHEKDIDHVFQPFYRAKHKVDREGTGLGLAISKMIVLRHKGELTVTSKINEGSTFSFTIPSASASTYVDRSYSGEHSDGMDDSLQDSSESLEIDSSHDEI